MFQSYIGEIAALTTAIFWTITALAFERASKEVGSLSVNLIRLLMALVFFCILHLINYGTILPFEIESSSWVMLILSGAVGFVLGDYFLFKSYEIINARIAMLIMALVPPITAILGWFFLSETMSVQHIVAMFVTLGGIAVAVLERSQKTEENSKRKLQFAYSVTGILLAFGGALGQSGGLILSKIGMKEYDAFASSQIRVIAGVVGFVIWITLAKHWKPFMNAIKNKPAMTAMTIGSFFGPFIGVSMSLLAVQHTKAGIASTLMSIVPVIIILPSVLILKEKVNTKEIVGALIAVLGVALFFI